MKVPAPLWRVMQGLRHSEAGNFVHAARNRLLLVGLRPGDTIGIDVTGRAGVGANLTHLLMGLAVCEARGLKPAIRITNPLYRREGEREWFANFFEQVAPPAKLPGRWLHLQKDPDHELLGSPADLSLADGKALFDRHVRVRPFLNEEVDALLDGYSAPVGVHYRGTDKGSEAPQVQQQAAIAAVKRALADRHDVIFLATDEPAFADALRAAVTDRPILMYEPEGLVPEPGVAVLWWNQDGFAKGVDALVNMLALARCDTVVRTASFLSGWANVLNPAQRVLMLNQAFSGTRFPDNVIQSDPALLDAGRLAPA